MTNQVATRPRIKRATAPARLHPSLTGAALPAAKQEKSPLGLLPVSVMVLAGLYAANAAEFTVEAWPLLVILALPVVALGYAWLAKPAPVKAVLRRQARTLRDQRPVLLRPVLVIPPGRPARIIGRAPVKLTVVPYRRPNRPARIRQQRWIIAERPI
jgi:hypothetical protein